MSNISYELAKKLKDAGFPQTHEGGYLKSRGAYLVEGNPESAYAPTLSELIEACGSKLALSEDGFHEHRWFAQRFGEGKERVSVGGATPEEAVANLWLSLHSK